VLVAIIILAVALTGLASLTLAFVFSHGGDDSARKDPSRSERWDRPPS
jgi:Tfp pilus assembly protein PilV